MTQDNLARDSVQDLAPAEGDALYDALVAALRGSARGRAFLDEYARRCRAADTAAALEALARIETLLTRDRPAEPLKPVSQARRSAGGARNSSWCSSLWGTRKPFSRRDFSSLCNALTRSPLAAGELTSSKI